MINTIRQQALHHLDWVFGAGYGTVMAATATLPIYSLITHTLVVTIVAFLAKKFIEHVYAWCKGKIKNRT